MLKRTLNWAGRLAVILAAGMMGGIVGRNYPAGQRVHAQEKSNSGINCSLTVPRSWGEYKGASAYGLAFQDSNGTLRFLLHPDCSNIRSYSDSGSSDLEVQRR